jgi:ADP-ribosylglycohydrolase
MPASFDKIMGCLAASQIGSAMGAAVEGWPWQTIRDQHGVLDQLLPYEHYRNGWQRPPGTTEDGIERQRVFLRAIRRVGGRIGPEDVAAVALFLAGPHSAYLTGQVICVDGGMVM